MCKVGPQKCPLMETKFRADARTFELQIAFLIDVSLFFREAGTYPHFADTMLIATAANLLQTKAKVSSTCTYTNLHDFGKRRNVNKTKEIKWITGHRKSEKFLLISTDFCALTTNCHLCHTHGSISFRRSLDFSLHILFRRLDFCMSFLCGSISSSRRVRFHADRYCLIPPVWICLACDQVRLFPPSFLHAVLCAASKLCGWCSCRYGKSQPKNI